MRQKPQLQTKFNICTKRRLMHTSVAEVHVDKKKAK